MKLEMFQEPRSIITTHTKLIAEIELKSIDEIDLLDEKMVADYESWKFQQWMSLLKYKHLPDLSVRRVFQANSHSYFSPTENDIFAVDKAGV